MNSRKMIFKTYFAVVVYFSRMRLVYIFFVVAVDDDIVIVF